MNKRFLVAPLILIALALLLPGLGGARATNAEVLSETTSIPTEDELYTPTVAPVSAPHTDAGSSSSVVPLIVHQPTPAVYGPDNFPIVVDPLTGLPDENFNLLDRRPMVVKVTNYPRSVRPQSGLSLADVVWEYYMERGIPRFIAVYYGQDAPKVGPVRSGRFFDEHVFRMYDGIFVFGSADHRVMDYFLSLEDHIINSFVLESDDDKQVTCSPSLYAPLCRDRKIISYNNMFTNTAALTDFITERNGNYRPELNGMAFADRTPPGGQLGLNVFLRYSLFIYHKWEYSILTGRYLRSQETIGYADPSRESYAPHMDALTGEQLAADNIVVLQVDHEWFTWTPTTEIINIHLIGSGQGYVFRDGFAFPVTWVRPKDGGIVHLFGPDGELFPLKPGVTWYQVISQYSTWSTNGIDWRFAFSPPPTPNAPINPEIEDKPAKPSGDD